MIRSPLEDKQGELFLEGVPASALAEEHDTPLYVTMEGRIRENYGRIKGALDREMEGARVLYSAKANSNLSVLRILEREGAGLDAVSPGEVHLALEAGFTPERILFTGTSVRDDEMAYLLDRGVAINLDSVSQMRRLLSMAVPPLVSVRVNPTLGAGHHQHVVTGGEASKFGVWEEGALEAYGMAADAGVERFGIQMHIGSGVTSPGPFLEAAGNLLDVAGKIREVLGLEFEFVDLGGGIGVPYRPGETDFDVDGFAGGVASLLSRKVEEHSLGSPVLWLELGRYLVAEAGVLLTRVNTIKATPFRKVAGVDAGFNTLVRPAMYGSYHHILVADRLGEAAEVEYDVAGPICESGDLLARERMLPPLREGDLLAVLGVGAYDFSMSSEYNSRPRAAEVLVSEGRQAVVRERESIEGLAARQRVAGWLED